MMRTSVIRTRVGRARWVAALMLSLAMLLPAAAMSAPAKTEPADATAPAAPADAAQPTDSEATPLDLPVDAEPNADDSDKATDDKGSTGGALARMIFGLVVVIGAIMLVQKLLKRGAGGVMGGRSSDGLVEVLTTTVLAPNRSLHLVRIGREVILVGATEHSVNHLQTLDRDNVPYLNHVTSGSQFEQALTHAMESGNGRGPGASGGSTFMQRFLKNVQELTAR